MDRKRKKKKMPIRWCKLSEVASTRAHLVGALLELWLLDRHGVSWRRLSPVSDVVDRVHWGVVWHGVLRDHDAVVNAENFVDVDVAACLVDLRVVEPEDGGVDLCITSALAGIHSKPSKLTWL